jgi:hypothetical protein
MTGPEDTAAWKKPSDNPGIHALTVCVKCKVEIVIWHCAELGCPWCAACGGANGKPDGA